VVIGIEARGTKEFALARRSVTLIVVCLINLGTFFPRQQEYAVLWRKSQQVFRCNRLNARSLLGLRADKLTGRLTKVFEDHKGNDSIRLVTGHRELVDTFAGISLNENGVSVVRISPIRVEDKHMWAMSEDQSTRQLNAAYILTAFWKLNGPRYVEKMKVRRQRYAARILMAFWKLNGQKFLARMNEQRRQLKAARILTNFWKLNGPGYVEKRKRRRRRNAARILTAFLKVNGLGFLEKMRERRRYLAPRYRYSKNCCLLVDMREGKNWTY